MAYLGPWAWVETGDGTILRILGVPCLPQRAHGPVPMGPGHVPEPVGLCPWAQAPGPWACDHGPRPMVSLVLILER